MKIASTKFEVRENFVTVLKLRKHKSSVMPSVLVLKVIGQGKTNQLY